MTLAPVLRSAIAATSFVALALFCLPSSAQEAVTGTTVTAVTFGDGSSEGGSYRKVGPAEWVETDAAGEVLSQFQEVGADEGSVSLEDASRGIALTLDLSGNQITYGAIGGEQQPIFSIVAATDDPIGTDAAAADDAQADADVAVEAEPDAQTEPDAVAGAEPVAQARQAPAPRGAPAAVAPQGRKATGLTVMRVVYGDGNNAIGELKQTGKTKWHEIDLAGRTNFKFDEVGRTVSGVRLEDRSRGVALTLDIANNVITYGAIGSPDQQELYAILSAEAGSSEAGSGQLIDDYIASLEYKPEDLLARPLDGSTQAKQLPKPVSDAISNKTFVDGRPIRDAQDGEVVITTATQQSFKESIDKITVLSSLPPEVFPGAVLQANQALVSGRPTPIALPRGPVTLTMSLQGGERNTATVDKPEISTVDSTIQELLKTWNETRGDATNADLMLGSFEDVQSMTEAQAKLGFNVEWASGSAKGLFEGSGSSDKRTLVGIFRQIFYTVSVDTPSAPSDFFAPGLPIERVVATMDNKNPPVYVNSIDYGRLIIVKVVLDKKEMDLHTEAEFEKELKAGKIGGEAEATFKQKYSSANFSALVYGGASDGDIYENEDLSGIKALIRSGTRYSPSNPGLPLSYSVRFLKDNSFAKIVMAGDYINYDSVIYPNGYVQLKFDGWYIGQFWVKWTVDGEKEPAFFSGKQSRGWKQTVPIPGDAKNVRVEGEGASGLAWETGPFSNERFYREAISWQNNGGPPNACITIFGESTNMNFSVGKTGERC